MDTLTAIYNWGTSVIRSFYADEPVGMPGCNYTPAPAYDPAPASSGASPITLERSEIDAIMNLTAGRGNACEIHDLPPGPNPDNFWNDAARYIIETKFSATGRNESGHGVREALNALSEDQRNEVINRLATILRDGEEAQDNRPEILAMGHPLSVLGEHAYALGCARGSVLILNGPFPAMSVNVTYAALLTMITAASLTIPAEAPASSTPAPAVDLPHIFVITDISPQSGARASTVTLTISGNADNHINFFGADNALPQGLALDLGDGITVGNPTRTETGNLQFSLTITNNAEQGHRPIALNVADQATPAYIGCYSFEVTRGITAPAPANTAPAPTNTAPAPANTAPAPTNTAPQPEGNPFEL